MSDPTAAPTPVPEVDLMFHISTQFPDQTAVHDVARNRFADIIHSAPSGSQITRSLELALAEAGFKAKVKVQATWRPFRFTFWITRRVGPLACLLLVLATGCAGISATVQATPRCGAVINDARADCTDIQDTVRIASDLLGDGGDTAKRSTVTVAPLRYLYRLPDGNVVRGTTQCVNSRPVITVDRTMVGLLHELLHAQDCLSGRSMAHDERHAWADRMMWRFSAPRYAQTAEDVARDRFAQEQAKAVRQ